MSFTNSIMINEYPSYEKVWEIINNQIPGMVFSDYSAPIHNDTKLIWDNLNNPNKIKKYANIMCSYFIDKENAFSQLQKCFDIILAVMRYHIKGKEDDFIDDWYEIKCNLNKGFEGVCGWAI